MKFLYLKYKFLFYFRLTSWMENYKHHVDWFILEPMFYLKNPDPDGKKKKLTEAEKKFSRWLYGEYLK